MQINETLQNAINQTTKELGDIRVQIFDLKVKEVKLNKLKKGLEKQLAELNETEKEHTK